MTGALFQQAGEHPADVRGEAWPSMLNVRDVYEAELARCRATFDSVNWTSSTVAEKHLRCTECGSDLVEQRDSTNPDQEKLELVCRGCGAEPDWDDATADAVARALSNDAYARFKDAGGPGPVSDVPACERAAFVDFEEA